MDFTDKFLLINNDYYIGRTDKMEYDVHGSCVSRSLLNGADEKLLSCNLNFSRNCLVSSVMPPAELPTTKEELFPNLSDYQNRCMRYAIDKSTVQQLLESTCENILIDFFDLMQNVACYKNTTFSTYDTLFFGSKCFKQHKEEIGTLCFLEIPTFLWYGYVDIYFQKIMDKYKKVILVRITCADKYISKNG